MVAAFYIKFFSLGTTVKTNETFSASVSFLKKQVVYRILNKENGSSFKCLLMVKLSISYKVKVEKLTPLYYRGRKQIFIKIKTIFQMVQS